MPVSSPVEDGPSAKSEVAQSRDNCKGFHGPISISCNMKEELAKTLQLVDEQAAWDLNR